MFVPGLTTIPVVKVELPPANEVPHRPGRNVNEVEAVVFQVDEERVHAVDIARRDPVRASDVSQKCRLPQGLSRPVIRVHSLTAVRS